jgi:hypothetical protein
MVKVCFISPEYLPLSGGTGAYVYYLSNELMKHGDSAYIVTGYDESRDVKVNQQHYVFFLFTRRGRARQKRLKASLTAGSTRTKSLW